MQTIPGIPDLNVGTIFCIGRNYQKHADEMESDVPDKPMVFIKPVGSLIGNDETINLPPESQNVHHEVELVIVIGKGGKHINKKEARNHMGGYGIGIDVTARDIQSKAKSNGHPWSVAKGFDTFAPVSEFKPVKSRTDFGSMNLSLSVNGRLRQQGNTRDMIFSVAELIAYLSTIFSLQRGDLIFTGTPDGVSAIQAGDQIQASLNSDEIVLNVTVNRD